MAEQKKGLKRRVAAWYGNRSWTFDLSASLLITIGVMRYLWKSGTYQNITLTSDLLYSIIQFFGVLAGFLLTAFSLLYLYNPPESKKPKEEDEDQKSAFEAFRQSPLFRDVLRAFPHAILLTILFILAVYLQIALSIGGIVYASLAVFLLLVSVLRIVRCLYLMMVVIDIGNAPRKGN